MVVVYVYVFQSSDSDDGSLLQSFILPGFVRLCETLGDDFANCFPSLIPILCQLAGSQLKELSGLQSHAQHHLFSKAGQSIIPLVHARPQEPTLATFSLCS